jgi:hypothetical protein
VAQEGSLVILHAGKPELMPSFRALAEAAIEVKTFGHVHD